MSLRQCDCCGYEASLDEFTVIGGQRLCSFCGHGVPRGRMKTYREHASGGAQIVQGFTRGR